MKKSFIILLILAMAVSLAACACSDTKSGSDDSSVETFLEADSKAPSDYTYEEYLAMSGDEQAQFFASFETPADFFAWHSAAMAAYDEEQGYIEVDANGVIALD